MSYSAYYAKLKASVNSGGDRTQRTNNRSNAATAYSNAMSVSKTMNKFGANDLYHKRRATALDSLLAKAKSNNFKKNYGKSYNESQAEQVTSETTSKKKKSVVEDLL